MEARGNLRKEISINSSGKLLNESLIPLLKEQDYIVKNYKLDGDAPKQFIKAYFYQENSTVRRSSSGSWIPYIAKTAEKWYPQESVVEYMINRMGQVLGINMNEIKLIKANGQIRFLSKYFLNKNEKLIHGAEICGEYLNDMRMAKAIADHKTTSRELFTFEFIKDAIRMVFPEYFEDILAELVKMITFDALAGNNDRHFYNWGVIDTKKKTSKKPTFAPLYDSARGLLWNESDENCRHLLKLHQQNGKKVINYIENASPRISIEENKEANHFQLIDFIKRYNKEYGQIVNILASFENQEKVIRMVGDEFFPLFIPERCELIKIIIESRFDRIRSI
ncbi:MAG: HipA domain-containing protein [Chitinophagaceae bacterium]|nr:HipA domain-containing protein [Chitinophagaceae bacterium]